MKRTVAALVVVAAAVGAACGSSSDARPTPGEAWDRGDAADAGFDPDALEAVAADAEASGANCLVVTRHGRIVADWYWNGTDAASAQEVYSVTKSVASTVVGLAQADGALDVGDHASRYVEAWEGTPSEDVTVENLVSNDSGRHWDAVTDTQGLLSAPDRTRFALDLGQDEPPGDVWVYNNSAIQTLDAVLSSATGTEPARYARDRLFEPLGMRHTEMTRDSAGNTNMFSGMQSTCEDLARLGELYLQDGRWGDDEILPSSWIHAATGRASQDLSGVYGYLWWLNRTGRVSPASEPTGADTPVPVGQLVPGAPEDMFWALGAGGQVVQVDPGSDTVVVRLGPPNPDATYGSPNTARVVTEALVDP